MSSLEPLGEIIAYEIAKKMELSEGLRFDFKGLWAHDLAGRATAFKNFIAGGMAVERAAGLSGLVAMEGGE